ncbi:MFS transporter [Pseudooceanicola nitratireducens]|jgi:MFS family permease|uniref:MFS transporter n=1 Tax=Pseudooceanicola nitratireducens TaxID=517719 RepID=UPI001C962DF4|nr:MFS transporter [Pseudooceanicola nitratireducens]MBY6164486.1 MFS transporter [Pseudooceanicola nitratireducens]MEC7792326.1 MFS transporter [Pseudomonadota bacterium]MEC8669356.1 MFS transporter [Pseudomonadota bacterium]|eukprot:g16950.t1
MRIDLFLLVIAYVLSQFFRSFLPVLTNVLETDIGADAADLSLASGMWFLIFAAMQIPVGWALDQLGPRRTSGWLLLIGGGGGAALFALAQAPWQIVVAMGLIGVGCSPVLMASYYILARVYPAAMFATFAALIIAFGQAGNLAGSLPLALAVELLGWRLSLGVLALASVLVALLLLRLVIDPPPVQDAPRGSLLDVLKIRGLWLILPLTMVNYAPAAGMRGMWAGPFFAETYGADARLIGYATLIMATAMILGTFVYGPLDRIFGTRKWINVTGATISVGLVCWLAVAPPSGLWYAAALFAVIGMVLSNYPMLMAHGRAFLPPHLVGRGVTLMNLFSIGGAGLAQVITGPIYAGGGFVPVFLFYAGAQSIGLLIYLMSRDRMD